MSTRPTPRERATTRYVERLHVPLRWWVQATMLVASLWLAFVVALPGWAALSATAVVVALTAGIFSRVGRAQVVVDDDSLVAGRANVPLHLLGATEVLDAEGNRRVLGVDADARAFLLTRPYLSRSVRVPLLDPDDPAPYWLLGTRHPEDLAHALDLAVVAARARHASEPGSREADPPLG